MLTLEAKILVDAKFNMRCCKNAKNEIILMKLKKFIRC